jgi:acyl-CoA dehydrogenase
MEHEDLQDMVRAVRQFVRSEVVPEETTIEESDAIPGRIRQQAIDMGLYGFALPIEHGGLGMTMTEEVQLVFELGYTTPAFRSMFGTNNGIAGHVLIEGATDEQKRHLLPGLASGAVTAAFALTEAEAGSDPAGLVTRARRDGVEWVIDGAKRYITNAPIADVFMVFARTSKAEKPSQGISVFMVPRDAAGLSVAPKDTKMGQAGAWTADVYLDEVRVPESALVGASEGTGYETAMRCLAHGRLHIAALCVGLSERLVDESLNFALERRQGGKPIAEHQLIQGMLADSQTEYLAAPRSCWRVPAPTTAARTGVWHPPPASTSPARRRTHRRSRRTDTRRRRLHAGRPRRAPLSRRAPVSHLRGNQPDPATRNRWADGPQRGSAHGRIHLTAAHPQRTGIVRSGTGGGRGGGGGGGG